MSSVVKSSSLRETMRSNSISYPMITIQSDWDQVIRRPVANVWLSSKSMSEVSVHQTIRFNDRQVVDCDPFHITLPSNYYLRLENKDTKQLYGFIAANHVFADIHNKSVSSIDLTSGGLGVSVGADSRLRVWSSADGQTRRELIGHVFEPYFCRFFPSGEVILSGGADMQLKIWSAVTGECAATLVGHRNAILDSAFVERGRNLVTVSRDGTSRLWDCSTSSCLETIIQLSATAINTCAIQSMASDVDLGVRHKPVHEKAVGTARKMLVIGTEKGSLIGIGLDSNQKLYELPNNSAVNVCRFVDEYSVVFGQQSGEIQLIDVRYSDKVVKCWQTSGSPVLSLLAFRHKQRNGFFAGRADGSTVYHYLDSDSETFQLSGPDFEAIYDVATDGTHVFTACRDHCIRKYDLNVITNS